MTWTPLYLPLGRGLDLSKELVAGGAELHQALNIDFGPDGSVKGRPSRGTEDQFYVLDPSQPYGRTPTYLAASSLYNTALVPSGLHRMRDGTGEKAVLTCEGGRAFSHEGSAWYDRGHFACARVDQQFRVPVVSGQSVVTSPSTQRRVIAPDFAHIRYGTDAIGSPDGDMWQLFDSTGAASQRVVTSNTNTATALGYPGTGNQSGTTSAVLYRSSTSNNLYYVYRTAGSSTLTKVLLANDALAPSDIGDAPVLARGPACFYVGYRTTTADTFKVLKISLTGCISWTYTKATGETGLQGLWVDSASGFKVLVAFTHSAGLTVRQLDTSAGTISGSDCTDTTGAGYDVVVGEDSSTRAFYAYRCTSSEHLVVGYATLGSGTTTVLQTFRGIHSTTQQNHSLRWSIVHQPVRAGYTNVMYLTLACSTVNGYTATWLTLNLSNWYTALNSAVAYGGGPFPGPTIVARGPTDGTYPHKQPCPAYALSDNSGFVFPTQDWQSFGLTSEGNLTGIQAATVLNKVTVAYTTAKPRCAALGETTVFSGSVPHMMARGNCVELGWPFLAGEPGGECEFIAGGSIPAGSYSMRACWKWVDEAGQIHRSAPSPVRTSTSVAGSAQQMRCYVVAPWLTEKDGVSLEIYVNSLAAPTVYTLQSTSAWTGASSEPSVTVNLTSLTTTGEALYTNGATLANYHVPADGGVAAVGRRLWVASADKVFASKLWTKGYGPEFNDDAANDQPSLYVNLPAGAGRVMALEALDDKLVIFCARGIFLVQDGGPSNTGTGADFAPAIRVSDLAIAGARSACLTDAGVLFCTSLDTVDPARSGPWLIDRQFTFTQRQYLGRQALDCFSTTSGFVPDVAYAPERQQAYITTDRAAGSYPSSGVVVVDFRVEKWATWELQHAGGFGSSLGAVQNVAVIGGILWALNNNPAPYNLAPGTDTTAGAVTMTIKSSDIAADGKDPLGWARVRSVNTVQGYGSADHTLTLSAVQDRTRSSTSGSITQTQTSSESTWPTSRFGPEWRLPVQKCSTIQVQASASPAVAVWSAIRLDVAPMPLRGPAKIRS